MELGQPTKNQARLDLGDVPAGLRNGALSLTVQPGMVTKAEPGEVYRSQP